YGKRGIQIEWKRMVFERLQYFDEDIYRKAVIERLAIYTIAHLNKIAFTCNGIPHTDNFFQLIYRISCIDKIVANLRHPVAFFRSHEVNGFATHDTDYIFTSMNNHPLCCQCFRIKSAKRMKSNKAIVIDMSDHKADLIHMGGHHDL